MSNARTFLWLFIYVQAGFITLDLYEHWRLARGTSIRDSLRKNFPLIFAIAIACLAYFALQLALASTLPTISRVTDLANRIVSASSAEPNRLWTIPAFLADIFGPDNVGAIHGALLTAWSGAAVVGPVIITELSNRAKAALPPGADRIHIYDTPLQILAGLLAVGFLLTLLVRPLGQSQRPAEDTAAA